MGLNKIFSSPPRLSRALQAALVAGVFLLGLASIGPRFLWDDQFFIQENRFLSSWTFLPELLTRSITEGAEPRPTNFYRPLQGLTHFFDVQAFGLNASLHHLTSIVLQALGAALFFLLFYSLTPAIPGPEGERRRAWAAFFALSLWYFHPLQSQAVGYLSGRGELLVALFTAAAALLWPRRRALALLACFAAVLGKENGVMAPAFVALTDLARLNMRGDTFRPRRAVLRYLPLALPVLAYVLVRLSFFHLGDTLNFYRQANPLTEHYSYRVFTYCTTLAKGLQLVLFPVDLHHERSWLIYPDASTPLVQAGIATLLIFAALIAGSWRRAPLVCVGLAWFLLAGLPTSNLVALINALIYDHWFLMPALGLALAALWLFARALGRYALPAVAAGWLLLFLPLSALTFSQHRTWRSGIAQYEQILRYEPRSSKILNNLAMEYADEHRTEDAVALYRRSLEIQETPQARNNLGNAFAELGRFDEAVPELRRAVELMPELYQAHRNLGKIALFRRECSEAARHFAEALRVYPSDEASAAGLRAAEACGH